MKRQHVNTTLQPQQSLENLTKSRGQSLRGAKPTETQKIHEKHRVNSHEVAGGQPLTDDSNGTKSNDKNTHINVNQVRHNLIDIQIQIVISFEWGFKIQLQ